MTEQEYNLKVKEMLTRHEKELFGLAKSFALQNNPYTIGDVVKDHIGKVLVESIKIDRYSKPPRCVYFGTELKVDGTPKKNGAKRNVWQTNIES